jgi:serine/threonine protein kinase
MAAVSNNNNAEFFEGMEEMMEAMKQQRLAAAAAAAPAPASPKKTLKALFNNARKNASTLLGKGGYGSVRRTMKNSRPVAIKRVIFNESVKGDNNIKSLPNKAFFNKEVNALRTLQSNPYVLHYLNSETSPTNAYLMTELLYGGMTFDSFAKSEFTISNSKLKSLIKNLLLGLKSIHDAGYLHLDIKPSNIWIFPDDGMIKYMDFGMACAYPCILTSSSIGTPGYIKAPVKLPAGDEYMYDKTNDFYGLAKTLEFLLEYAEDEQKSILRHVIDELLTLNNSNNATDALSTEGGSRRRRSSRSRRSCRQTYRRRR